MFISWMISAATAVFERCTGLLSATTDARATVYRVGRFCVCNLSASDNKSTTSTEVRSNQFSDPATVPDLVLFLFGSTKGTQQQLQR
ncbi:hypothetical protein CPB84DRAFT_1763410 [Gymnopilus junonius]|uniref:Uncharacterized protein n=1 Tax=Gymnopilus junonius TaxID=109634 RepID=A0A9P5P160_GYMJU|nr:hypothetical protein CPB84DRAFT_1763410 [Gymnopilus junonius]